eukprot:6174124-Pleurochrysis_carterae.AAC.1
MIVECVGAVEGAVELEEQMPDEQEVPDMNMGEDGIRLPSADAGLGELRAERALLHRHRAFVGRRRRWQGRRRCSPRSSTPRHDGLLESNCEVYRVFDLKPVLSDTGNPGSAPRYAPSCLSVKLMAGECVELDGGVHFVPAVTGSVAAAGKLSKELPCRAWACAFLLGGVWNNTKGRMEKPRWTLLLLVKDTEPEVT